MPLDAPVVAVLKEDALLSAVGLVARGTLAAQLDVELDKVDPRSIQIPAHQLSFPSLAKGQRHHGFSYLGAPGHSVVLNSCEDAGTIWG